MLENMAVTHIPKFSDNSESMVQEAQSILREGDNTNINTQTMKSACKDHTQTAEVQHRGDAHEQPVTHRRGKDSGRPDARRVSQEMVRRSSVRSPGAWEFHAQQNMLETKTHNYKIRPTHYMRE